MTARGFTLVEVMVALTILLIVVTGLAGTTARTVHTVTVRDRQAVAIELAGHRLDQARATPDYAGLEATYAGVESAIAGHPGYTRTTEIVRVGGIGLPDDYKKITVTVAATGLPVPVVRTTTIAAP